MNIHLYLIQNNLKYHCMLIFKYNVVSNFIQDKYFFLLVAVVYMRYIFLSLSCCC